uniref:Uncharacterized protein n=1 Tax=viral metagenome TaxID=1070528 RepID=A0A6C0JX95_9ZZZZ
MKRFSIWSIFFIFTINIHHNWFIARNEYIKTMIFLYLQKYKIPK